MVAIPAWNQEAKVASVVLLAKKYADTVLVIDDGSTDRTAEVSKLAGALVVTHDQNRGYGAGLWSCFKYAHENDFDAMIILDSDGQHDPDEIPTVFAPILNGSADVSIGSRFLNENIKIPFYRKVGINVITSLTNQVTGKETKISDSQSGFRAYSKKAIDGMKIKDTGMGASVEILLESNKMGLHIIEVPISIKYDEDSSTQNPVKHGMSVIGSIVRYVEFEHPLLIFGLSGFILLLISLLVGMWSYYSYLESHYLPFGPTLVALFSLISGLLLGITGLILHAVISANSRMWVR